MSEPFIAEIRIFSFPFAPRGWALSNGQLLPINQNQALFSLLGTTYGGNGQNNFALPNLQGLTPLHMGQGLTLGERGGEQAHTLIISELPAHNHMWNASATNGAITNPSGAQHGAGGFYDKAGTNLTTMAANELPNAGGSQPHNNMQPYLTLNLCIALQGIFPSRN